MGIARAGDLLRQARAIEDSDALAAHLITEMANPQGYSDDVAMLLYRHPAPLHLTVAAEVGQLASTRDALRTWLLSNELAPEQVQDLPVAVGEAIANSIEHGHRGGRGGSVTLSGHANGETIHLRIVDAGAWKPADDVPHLSRGTPS